MKTLNEQITSACALPSKQRLAALKQIKWRLYCPQLGLWAGLDSKGEIIPCTSAVDPAVQVFDGRDNESSKVRFYSIQTGINWSIELCAS